MTSSGYQHLNAPETVFEKHLRAIHGKSNSWVEENQEDLRSAHFREHNWGRADHDLNQIDI